MKYELAIFDMDGTILDSIEDLKDSLNHALKRSGLPERSLKEVTGFVGDGIRKLMERGVPSGTPIEVIDQVHRDFLLHYEVHYDDKTKPYEGILELLQELKRAGCKTAVLSNKVDDAVKKLERCHFAGLFDAARGERPGVAKKPAPDGIQAILRELDVPGERTVYIGDTEVDIATARNAGLDCIVVGWGYRDHEFLRAQGAAEIMDSPEAVLAKIL